jgi:hypothetical protein
MSPDVSACVYHDRLVPKMLKTEFGANGPDE